MSRAISVAVYKFAELSPTAKTLAKQSFAAAVGYVGASDALASITKLAEHFGGTLKRYEIDWFNSMPCAPPTFEMPELEPDDVAAKLAHLGMFNPDTLKGLGDCKLTGYCMDEDAIDGLRIAWHGGERDLTKLMLAAYDSWLKAAQEDCESFYTDEAFTEHCDNNEDEFYEDGELL